MEKYIIGIVILCMGLCLSCNKEWDAHYDQYPDTVEGNIWDEIRDQSQFSDFVKIVEEAEMDTLFETDIAWTILAPTNEAISEFQGYAGFSSTVLAYHFCSHYINTSNIRGKRQVQTLTEKFAFFERKGSDIFIDGVEVATESPLYKNGKFFTMDQVMEPKPNLYEYYQFTNPVFTAYIDSQDTIIIDKEKSNPLGFDEFGNTVYDTVSEIENKFEMEYLLAR